MSNFRIHEDQENRVPGVAPKQAQIGPAMQKRNVLGQLNNQLDRQQAKIKAKQPLGVANTKAQRENSKKVAQKVSPSAVPVAQFEAFKVYEDVKENEQIAKATTAEAPEIQRNKQKEILDLKPKQEGEDEEITETLLKEEAPTNVGFKLEQNILVTKCKSNKESFFENEEYRTDIYAYLRELERANRPKSGYMRKQPDITYSMRTILVDWLVEVAEEYKLQSETLFLTINYIDRFLSYMSVVRAKLQLVGTAAMFIAAKYEEIYPPEIGEFVYITDDTYTKKQVIRMEHLILKVLSFDLSVPTPLTFITDICIGSRMPQKVMNLAMYLSELAMLEADSYIEMYPSVLAASAIAIARYTLSLEPWTAEMKQKTGYELSDLKKCMEFLYVLYCKAPSLAQQAIQEKFKSSKYLAVSQIPPRTNGFNN